MIGKVSTTAIMVGMLLTWSGAAFSQSGTLENPKPQATKSGIGVISGWHCDTSKVTVSIDNGNPVIVPHGSSREDTRSVCGDADNGFALQVNYNLYGDGTHTVKAYADGRKFADTQFQVATFGSEFLQGRSGIFNLEDFPSVGRTTVVKWEESTQAFQIQGSRDNLGTGLNGGYELRRVSLQTVDQIADSDQSNFSVSGEMTVLDGRFQQHVQIRANGETSSVSLRASCDDFGYRLECVADNGQSSSVVIVKRNENEIITSGSFYVDGYYVNEIDHWVKTSNNVSSLSAFPASTGDSSLFAKTGMGAFEAAIDVGLLE